MLMGHQGTYVDSLGHKSLMKNLRDIIQWLKWIKDQLSVNELNG